MGYSTKTEHDLRWLVTRRSLLGTMGSLAAVLPVGLSAQQESVLPLDTPGVDHLDIIVPDVAAAAAFYMQVFNTTLHAQPLGEGVRYFILLGEMNENREVGYVAIGESRGRGTYIGHYCTTVHNWRQDSSAIFAAMEEEIESAGFGTFPGSTGFGGIFSDPDGIEIQYLPAPDTLVRAAVPSDLVPSRQGLVTPRGMDHVHLYVSDLESAAAYYTILYGSEVRRNAGELVYFDFPVSETHLVLEQVDYTYGNSLGIAHFGIKVESFDRQALISRLTELGAQVLTGDDDGNFRFRDLDGITVELVQI
jgi:catechol 2,3-dioxygenase-like lactoylglutathione lyase family enzyme